MHKIAQQVNFNYNTQQEPIVLREYGRSIQQFVNLVCKEPDREKRTQMAIGLKNLIEKLPAASRDSNENTQQNIWDNLHIISNFKLDVDIPFPPPKRELLNKKPNKMEYPRNKSFSRYGKNIEKLVKSIIEKEDPKERETGTIYLGRLISTFYGSWNKGSIDTAEVLKNIEKMSDNKLTLDLERVEKENLFERLSYEKRRTRNSVPQASRKGKPNSNKRYGGSRR